MLRHNTLIVESVCPYCLERAPIKIQFQYGEVWDYVYYINDTIKWGSVNAGIPGRRLVVLDGAAEECYACGETLDYFIFTEYDVIKSVRQNDGEYQFFGAEGFQVLDE